MIVIPGKSRNSASLSRMKSIRMTEIMMEKQSSAGQEVTELNQEFAQQFPMQILIAEDNPLNQKLIQKMLRKLGYEPVIVEDGGEALDAVKSASFHLILMDLQMPKVDGIEATKLIIEQIPEKNRPSIIALTAAVSSDVEQNCMDAGMKGFISKPISIRRLAEVLKQYY